MRRAPSYSTVCLFGAAWNAVIVRSLLATVFCVGLALVFAVGGRIVGSKRVDPAFLVVGGGVIVLLTNAVWLVTHGAH